MDNTKISVLGDILTIETRTEDALKQLRTFLGGSEMLSTEDLAQAEAGLKNAVKRINDIKSILKVFKELADKRYVENNQNNSGETA